MNPKNTSKPEYIIRRNKAVTIEKSYCVNKDVICALPKGGGNDAFRPSVIAKESSKK